MEVILNVTNHLLSGMILQVLDLYLFFCCPWVFELQMNLPEIVFPKLLMLLLGGFFLFHQPIFARNFTTLRIIGPLKTGYFEDPTPAMQVQTLPLEGSRSLGQEISHSSSLPSMGKKTHLNEGRAPFLALHS